MPRMNLVDAAMLVGAVAVVALGVAAAGRLRIPPPEIASVSPATITAGQSQTLTIHGRYLQPYLRVVVNPTGAPFSIDTANPTAMESRPARAAATVIETPVPALATGVYDVFLLDEFHRVAVRPSAFTVVEPVLRRATIAALFRSFVAPESVRTVAVGDRDQFSPDVAGLPKTGDAVVTGVRVGTERREQLELRIARDLSNDGEAWLGPRSPLVQFDLSLQIPAVTDQPGAWSYKGVPLRAGESMFFQNARTKVLGTIVSTEGVPE